MIHRDWMVPQSGIGWNFYIGISKENLPKYFILKTETTKVPQCLAEDSESLFKQDLLYLIV